MTTETRRLTFALIDRITRDAIATVEQIQHDDRDDALTVIQDQIDGTRELILDAYQHDNDGSLVNADDLQAIADAKAREHDYFADRRAA